MQNNTDLLLKLRRRNYLELLKLMPNLRQQTARAYFTLALTFGAITIFGLFAINPTLQTISHLKKQLADNKLVLEQLITKSNNLASLYTEYTTLQSDVPILFSAIPQTPAAPTLIGQLQALAEKNQIKITSLQTLQVDLTKQKAAADASFAFSLDAQGPYQQLVAFSSDMANFERIITLEKVGFTNTQDLIGNKVVRLTIKGRAFFEPAL